MPPHNSPQIDPPLSKRVSYLCSSYSHPPRRCFYPSPLIFLASSTLTYYQKLPHSVCTLRSVCHASSSSVKKIHTILACRLFKPHSSGTPLPPSFGPPLALTPSTLVPVPSPICTLAHLYCSGQSTTSSHPSHLVGSRWTKIASHFSIFRTFHYFAELVSYRPLAIGSYLSRAAPLRVASRSSATFPSASGTLRSDKTHPIRALTKTSPLISSMFPLLHIIPPNSYAEAFSAHNAQTASLLTLLFFLPSPFSARLLPTCHYAATRPSQKP